MDWIWQRKGNELGNFLMMTPALRLLYLRWQGQSVPVFFETKAIAELLRNCPFLTILPRRPMGNPLYTSNPPKNKNKNLPREEVRRFARVLCGKFPRKMPRYYIDQEITYPVEPSSKKRIAIFHGCNALSSRAKQRKKRLPVSTRQHMLDVIIEAGLQPALLGSQDDDTRFWSLINVTSDVENYLGKLSLRDTVSVLAQCDGFISNDTGLYHAAVAVRKPGLVLWKQTDPEQNKAPGDFVEHFVSQTGDAAAYNEAIDIYVKATYVGATATGL